MTPAVPAQIEAEPRFELGIDEGLLARLGTVVVLRGYVEMLVGRLLAHFCDAEPASMLFVASDLSSEALVRNAGRLAELKLPPETYEAVHQVLVDADLLRREFDMLVRGQWDRGPDPGTALVATPHPVHRDVMLQICVAGSSLEEIEEHANHVMRQLARLCLEIGVRFD